MKYTRLLLGIGLVLVALWIIIGEQMSGASGDAVVNARVVTLRAPTAGNLSMPNRSLGARVARGEAMADVTDPLVDAMRLDDLRMEAGFNAAAITQIQDQLAAVMTRRDALVRGRDLARPDLAAGPVRRISQAAGQIATDASAIVPHRSDAAPGSAPALPGRIGDLNLDIAMLNTRLTEARSRAAAIDARLTHEKLRVNALTGAEIASPVNGQLWEIIEADGVNIQRGDPILRLVDCGSVMVTLSVSQRVYNSLRLGQSATFRLEGKAQVYPATISRMAGSGAQSLYRNLAVAPSQRHLERYDVALLVADLASEQDGCMIGKTGRVFFDRRPLDWLRDLRG